MNMQLLIVGAVAFGLHFLGKWKETTDPFTDWLFSKNSIIYWLTSLALCALSLYMVDLWAPAMGMEPFTYSIVMCYGGGHAISRLIGISGAAAEKKMLKSFDKEQS